MESQKAVMITGASTGIGKACALYLDNLGFKVFAGVRRPVDGDDLKGASSGQLTPILLDVTGEQTIEAAVSTIAADANVELCGLLNNAGIAVGGTVETLPVADIRKVLEVNVVGLMAVTQAFIPLLRKNRGRIINIGSSSSFMAFPGGSIYSASKFAVRAITDTLRVELKPFHMPVVLVAPGPVESEIWAKAQAFRQKLQEDVSSEIAELYAPLSKFGDKLLADLKKLPAHEVAKAVTHALTARKPKRCYFVGKDARGARIAAGLPKALTDALMLKRINQSAA